MEPMKKYSGTGPYRLRYAVLGLLFEGVLLFALLWVQGGGHVFIPEQLWLKSILVLLLVLCSNIASTYIVGWYKDYFLWPRAGSHPDDPQKSLREWWKQENFGSTLSGQLGFVERVVVTATGLVSFQSFFIACAGWLTLKTAVEWQQFSGMKHRVISHIYLISSTLSLVMAALDVAVIRTLLGLSL